MSIVTPNMGLTSWSAPGDFFSHTDLANNWTALDNHDHSAAKGVPIPTGGLANQAVTQTKIANNAVTAAQIANQTITAGQIANTTITGTQIANSTITATQIASATITASRIANNTITATQVANNSLTADTLADAARLGISGASTVRRGKTNIATSESTSSTSFTTLTTPDKIASVVLPTDGLIMVLFQGIWQESVFGAARAAIFIGANQLKLSDITVLASQQTDTGSTASTAKDRSLFTTGIGLVSSNVDSNPTYGGDVTTGQIIGGSFLTTGMQAADKPITTAAGGDMTGHMGGPCYVFAAAGTYDVSVQFKVSSGSVTAKSRHLWVSTIGF